MSFTGNDYYNIGLRLRFPDLLNFFATSKSVYTLSHDQGFWNAYLKKQFGINKIFKLTSNQDSNLLKLAKHIYFFLLSKQQDESYVTHLAFQKFLDFSVEQRLEFVNLLVREIDKSKPTPPHPHLNDLTIYQWIIQDILEFELDDSVKYEDYAYGTKDPRMLLYPTVVLNTDSQVQPKCVFDASKIQFTSNTRFYEGQLNTYTQTQLEFIRMLNTYVHRETPYLSLDGIVTIPFDYEALDYILFSGNFDQTRHKNLYKFVNHVRDMYTSELSILLIQKFT